MRYACCTLILLFANAAFGQTVFNRITGWEVDIAALTPGECVVASSIDELQMGPCAGGYTATKPIDITGTVISLDFSHAFTGADAWTGQHQWSAGGIKLNDNIKAIFGTDDDIELYSDGSNFIIDPDDGGIFLFGFTRVWTATEDDHPVQFYGWSDYPLPFILSNTSQVVGGGVSLELDTGPGGSDEGAKIRAIVTQGDPSALKSELQFFTNEGDSLVQQLTIEDDGDANFEGNTITNAVHVTSGTDPGHLHTGAGLSGVNIFETMNAPAGTDPVADSVSDTLNLTVGTCLTLTGTAGTDTLDWAVDFSCAPIWTGWHTWSANGIKLDDNVTLILGSGNDALLYYNGSNLILDPDSVGSGQLQIGGDTRWADNVKVLFGSVSAAEIYFDGTDMVQKGPSGGAIIQQTDVLKWVTSAAGMTIKNVLGQDILVVDATDMYIKQVDLVVENVIDLWDKINIRPNNETISAPTTFLEHTSTITLDNLLSAISFFGSTGEFDITVTPLLFSPPTMFFFNANVRSSGGALSTFQPPVFSASTNFISDGFALQMISTGLINSSTFLDSPQFAVVGAGTYHAASDYIGFRSYPEVVTTTFPEYISYQVDDYKSTTGGTLTSRWGLLVNHLTSTYNYGIQNASTSIDPPQTQAITAVGQAITVTSSYKNLTANASYTLTSTPTIADGFDGQIVEIANEDTTDTITIQDQGTLAGSNLRLGAATRALQPRDRIVLRYDTTVGDWCEVSFSNVI